jgi:hypothetical protein
LLILSPRAKILRIGKSWLPILQICKGLHDGGPVPGGGQISDCLVERLQIKLPLGFG